jgi:DNA-binding transcriptional MerR regulator
MIKGAQRLGLSLDEIAGVIASDDASTSIESLAKRRVAEIDLQIAELDAVRDALTSYIH